MKILITGARGFLGTAITADLREQGHEVIGLPRLSVSGGAHVGWNPATGEISRPLLAGADAIIHLAGENIGAGRWTVSRKRAIRDSRIGPTRLLCEFLGRMDTRPAVLITASAIGYYGNRGEEVLDEKSNLGSGFLAGLVADWEKTTGAASESGIRVVNLRFGLILSPKGGALTRMLLPFKLGLGGPIGDGRQYWSWISLDDVLGAVRFALTNSNLTGPVNVVAPNPVTNREFVKTLARVMHRPAIFPLPAFMARLALGEMADELLLYSARVRPQKLSEPGFRFLYPDLEDALRHLLTRTHTTASVPE